MVSLGNLSLVTIFFKSPNNFLYFILGAGIGVKSAVIVGGMDMMSQAMMLAKKPHIIIATPGRLVDHLENTKGFSLKTLKFLVSYRQGCYYYILLIRNIL